MDGFMMGGDDLDELFEKAKHMAERLIKQDHKDEKRVVVRRIPVRPEWRAQFEQLDGMASEGHKLLVRLKHVRNKLWIDIEEAVGLGLDLHYNEGDQYIEVMKTPGDGGETGD